MKYQDFFVGQVIHSSAYEIRESELLEFAKAYDPQWFHTEKNAAIEGPFNGLIASGWHTCAIAMRLTADIALAGSESFASPGLDYVRWPRPVRPGDKLSLTLTVLETRRSEKRPTLGILRWRWQLFNHYQEEVLDLEATSMFDLSQEEQSV